MARSTLRRTGPRLFAAALALAAIVGGGLGVRAADHADSPDTSEGNLDGNDLYVFAHGGDLVFVLTVDPLLAPGEATTTAAFNPDGLYEIKLDRERDGVEDAVIQVAFAGTGTDQVMSVRGPVAVSSGGGVESSLVAGPALQGPLDTTLEAGRMKVFAGRRDDPFFVDLFGDKSVTSVLNAAFSAALGEEIGSPDEQSLEFNPDAQDDLAGLNVLAIVVEVPKSAVADALGIADDGTFYAWAALGARR